MPTSVGIVRGAGRDGLTLEYVPLQADVQVGDRVLIRGLKLKVILVDNPELKNRTTIATCSKWTATTV